MEDDDDYPIINMPEKVEEVVKEDDEEENDVESKPDQFFKKPEMSLKEKRLENLRKAREARAKKKEEKAQVQEPAPQPAPQPQSYNIDYDLLVNNIVDKLEVNKAKRKASKKPVDQVESVQSVQLVQQVRKANQYESLFGF